MHASADSNSDAIKPAAAPAAPGWLSRLRFMMRGNVLRSLEQIAAEQGDVANFRAGRADFWFFTHPDAVRDVLVTSDEKFIKGPALRRAKATLGDGLLTSEGDLHRHQRRLIQPVLHPQRVATYADVMVEYARQTSESWRDGQ